MASRYWVGGTAAWDGTAGSKWALTSGGAGGQAVPTSADDVFFDSASGAVTCTISSGNTGALSINCTGFTGTLTHGAANISVAGSVTLVAGMTFTSAISNVFIFTGTGTLTTAGKTFSRISLQGSGITITLGDALNIVANGVDVRNGTFTTASFNVTTSSFSTQGALAKTINLGDRKSVV